MDVKVDSKRIKLEREKRAWTQEHLAKVSGLGHRTVQRIEATGSASFESARALAAVLSLSVAELRAAGVSDSGSPRASGAFAGLPLRLLLAAVSGVGCALSLEWAALAFLDWPYIGFAGLLFGGAVLCPYLRPGTGVAWRAIALIAASSLSYSCALWIVINPYEWLGASSMESPQGFLLASFVGAGIVLGAARLLIPLQTTIAYWLFGALTYAADRMTGSLMSTAGGFVAWHVSMCLAIHVGRRSNAVGRRVAEVLLRSKRAPDPATFRFIDVTTASGSVIAGSRVCS